MNSNHVTYAGTLGTELVLNTDVICRYQKSTMLFLAGGFYINGQWNWTGQGKYTIRNFRCTTKQIQLFDPETGLKIEKEHYFTALIRGRSEVGAIGQIYPIGESNQEFFYRVPEDMIKISLNGAYEEEIFYLDWMTLKSGDSLQLTIAGPNSQQVVFLIEFDVYTKD